MTGIDNIKVAEWIRMYSDRVIIISITTVSDYNMQGYKYDVFRYLLKDSMDLKGSIYECMNAVLYKLNYINSDKRIISCDSGSKEVDVSKIIYIESSGHKVTYHILYCNLFSLRYSSKSPLIFFTNISSLSHIAIFITIYPCLSILLCFYIV